MKTRNDIIADYVREKYPSILTTVDFALYSFGASLREFGSVCKEALTNNTNKTENSSKTTFVKSSESD